MTSSPTENSSPDLEINLLGKFEIRIRGEPLREMEIKGRKTRSLLKILAHRRQHQMVRDHAVDILWPDLDESSANTQLYKAIHHIRKAFENYCDGADEWIEMTDNLLRLVPPGRLTTDVQRFENLARSGLRNHRIADLEKAFSIYEGEFLPMDRYSEWTSMPRNHYNQLYLDVLTTLAQQYEKQGNLSDAAEMMRLSLDKEPTLETAHRGVMRIFARKGQPTRAYHQFEVCRKVLGEELGVSPSSETHEMLDDIREGHYREELKKPSKPAMLAEPSSTIIGRKQEMDRIEQFLDDLAAERGNGLIISGEAGIGKSRLIREIILRARRRGRSFFAGRTGAGKVAYGPFLELFDDILHKQPGMEEELPVELGRLIPGFTGDGKPFPHADKLAAKGYLFAQIHRFFSKLAADDPLVIILEDLHAADQSSRDLFSYLLQHRNQLPILLAATLRKEEEDPLPEFIRDLPKQTIEHLELGPLSYEEHTKLLQQHAGNAIIGSDTADHIYQLAEGNPLYALELLEHYMKEDQDISSQATQDAEMSPSSPFADNIPASIHKMVEEKLENLSPPARHLLYIAAVIGRRVPYELLDSLWNAGERDEKNVLFNALEEAVHARLLEEQGFDYSFRHAIVQETIYATISTERRSILHKQVAEQLLKLSEKRDDPPVEQIARHYLGAGEMLKGIRYLLRAGERAESAYAHDDALYRYREACKVLDKVENGQTRNLECEIRERIGDVHRSCGRLDKSNEAYEKAISLAEEYSIQKTDLAELYRKKAVVAIFCTEIDRSAKCLEKAFELAGDDSRSQARLLITKALHLWHLNQLEEAYDLALQARSEAQKAEAKPEVSQACEILAMTCLPLGRWEEGLQYEMERQYHGWSPEIVVATDAHLCLWEYHVSGDQPLQKARSFMEQVAEQATEIGDLRCVAVCHYALGTMYLWRGNRHLAVKELTSSLELHDQVGSPAGMAYSLARKGVIHTLAGAGDLGWQAVQDGLDYARQAAVRDHCLQRLYGVGLWNRIETGNLDQARDIAKKSEELLDESGACAACAMELYPWLAYFYLYNDQFDQARACGEAVSQLAEKTGNPIGKAIASMINSNLCIAESDKEQANAYSNKAYQTLEEAVPESDHSPIARYLDRMAEQQKDLG